MSFSSVTAQEQSGVLEEKGHYWQQLDKIQ